jgi:hypothetical protein
MSSQATPPREPAARPVSGDRQLDFHPGMEMRWQITRSAADTAGELFEATNWIGPASPGHTSS